MKREAQSQQSAAGEDAAEPRAEGAGNKTGDRDALALPFKGAQQRDDSGGDHEDEDRAEDVADCFFWNEKARQDHKSDKAEAGEERPDEGLCRRLLVRRAHDAAVEQGVAVRAFAVDRVGDEMVAIGADVHGEIIALYAAQRPCLRVRGQSPERVGGFQQGKQPVRAVSAWDISF